MDIASSIKQCGVVGSGGAGFPTHVKVDADVKVAIINGAECEPLLMSDKFLLETSIDRIIGGLEYIMEATGAETGYIALKEKYPGPLASVRRATEGRDSIHVFPLGDYYPAGDEFLLVYEVTGKVVPEGGIPLHVGCVVDNVETALNVYEAVKNQRPVTTRYLTCTGEVSSPGVVEVPIGTPVSDVIELCGGPLIEDYVVVLGGPLMGKVETDLKTPVTKTTSGIIVLDRDHEVVRRKTIPLEFMVKQSRTVCCQCTYCTELCPRYLLGHDLQPHLIMRQIGYGIDEPARVIENAFLCSGCGLCEVYACVMGLSPSAINTVLKERLADQGYKPSFDGKKIEPHEMRDFRKIPTSRIVNRLQLTKYSRREVKRGLSMSPKRVEIPLKQHLGEPATAVVGPGDRVEKGSLIAEVSIDGLGAAVHASISGGVAVVDEERIIIERS